MKVRSRRRNRAASPETRDPHTHTELNLCLGFMSEKLPDVLSKETRGGKGGAKLLHGCLRLLVPFDPSRLRSGGGDIFLVFKSTTDAAGLLPCATSLHRQRVAEISGGRSDVA